MKNLKVQRYMSTKVDLLNDLNLHIDQSIPSYYAQLPEEIQKAIQPFLVMHFLRFLSLRLLQPTKSLVFPLHLLSQAKLVRRPSVCY